MGLYEYFCPTCNQSTEVVKSMSEAEAAEYHDCGRTMIRSFTTPRLNTSACIIEPHKNWGLGKNITTKNQLKEEVARHEGETGRKLIEVGSENLSSIKKQFKDY